MFIGEHCRTTELRSKWKLAISSRDKEVGSGRKRPAEKVAFAIASWCDAILLKDCRRLCANLCLLHLDRIWIVERWSGGVWSRGVKSEVGSARKVWSSALSCWHDPCKPQIWFVNKLTLIRYSEIRTADNIVLANKLALPTFPANLVFIIIAFAGLLFSLVKPTNQISICFTNVKSSNVREGED